MSASQDDSQHLNQLQTELNTILEQIGRLFASAAGDGIKSPNASAQALRLRKMLPGVSDRCHDALDQLEDRLQLAQFVMRRDLAVLREQASAVLPQEVTSAEPVKTSQAKKQPDVIVEPFQPNLPPASAEVDDPMDVDPKLSAAEPPQDPEHGASVAPDTKVSPKDQETSNAQNPAAKASSAPSSPQKVAESGLQVDTTASTNNKAKEKAQNGDDERPPDTAFSNTNDMDSLFGGPFSADAAEGEGVDFGAETNQDTDFDFGSFGDNADSNGVDNDNISKLLPGLQDYANTQPGGNVDADLDALFSAVPAGGADGQTVAGAESKEHPDTTFDGFIDFEDFVNADVKSGDQQQGADQNDDFDFDFS